MSNFTVRPHWKILNTEMYSYVVILLVENSKLQNYFDRLYFYFPVFLTITTIDD